MIAICVFLIQCSLITLVFKTTQKLGFEPEDTVCMIYSATHKVSKYPTHKFKDPFSSNSGRRIALAIPRALSNKFFSLLHWVFQCCGLFMLDRIIFRCYRFRYSVTTQPKFFLVDFWYHESINGWSKQDNVFQFHQYK